MKVVVPEETIERKIFMLRGQKVMLSPHLAVLYGVTPSTLIQAVKRNIERFPGDFMFQLTNKERENLKSQFVISSRDSLRSQNVILNSSRRGKHIKYLPYAFTEQGVAMLSSILRSKRAIQVNIAIMRAFVKLRQILATHKELAQKLRELENRITQHDGAIEDIFEAIRQLMTIPEKPKRRIGFHNE
ncbi:MAG: ORF6N domain-containing protein [Candidatus Omnitrophica bacterium]|nr:ORF6N domain-containing protein [Candidatus Omnitrophota bacterium]